SKTARAPYPVRSFYYTDADGPAAAFREAAQSLRFGKARLGVEAGRMRVMELRLVEDAFLNPRVDSADGIFAALRMSQAAGELDKRRPATAIAEKALTAPLPLVRSGQTERAIGAELVVQTLRAGSDPDLPFAPIVASGPNSALPHASLSERVLQAG